MVFARLRNRHTGEEDCTWTTLNVYAGCEDSLRANPESRQQTTTSVAISGTRLIHVSFSSLFANGLDLCR